ncbi:DUF5916 domain-containing protein [Mesoterricola silvestris]|uniref:DUF5916 domain-containing protein n=1 Tax=Mesoterricola silvestris TaxID=2927979 RepID=A0AA48GK86_9BACT|nr:DUF5916 domain-containing protein [Mesoterricola silvestris]BDU71294.1 hypothetical protein METEAL_04680 [Mesoterricola silvestris]
MTLSSPARSLRFARWAAFGILAWGSCLGAAGLQAIRTTGRIRLDGGMREPDWKRAPAATGFRTSWPDFGQEAATPTEVKVLYDEDYLYVGAHMGLPRGVRPVRRVHRRDQESTSDWFGVYIDSARDRRTAFGFLVNAAGVQRDALYAGDSMTGDSSWDAVWESQVKSGPGGWTAILKIPLSVLRLRGGDGVWGINFSRTDSGAIRESSYWDLPPRGENAFASRFPDLTGIKGVTPRLRREWIPFFTFTDKFHTAKAYDDRRRKGNAGVDAHLGLTPASQLDLTVRPDFAQVEVDQAVLNLSTVETVFPEKRPFFLEGMEIFQFPGVRLFYSRRIGRSLASPSLDTGQTLLDGPPTAEIAAAAKYTAKLDTGLTLGSLAAGVENARGVVGTEDGGRLNRSIAPYATYGVVRAIQTLDHRGSTLGGFASMVREADPAGRSARVGAMDAVLKSSDRSSQVDLSTAWSQAGTRGSEVDGFWGYGRFFKRWNSGWRFEVNGDNASRNFNPNDLGYQARADEQRGYIGVARHWDQRFLCLRNWEWGADFALARDQEGKVFQRTASAWASTDFTNFWSVWGNAHVALPVDDDRELRTYSDPVKKYLHRGSIPGVGLGFDTPGNRPWYVRITASRSFWPEGPTSDAGWYQSIKLGPAMEIQSDTSVTRNEGELRYLETQGTTPVVGLRRMTQFNETLRLAYAMTPRLSLQVLGQWLMANWDFRNLQSYVDDATLAPGAASATTSFSDRVWNQNVIVRWEFNPGSTAFFVYTHGVATDALINDRGSLSPRADVAVLSRLPSDDAFQVKVSWMFR